MANVKITIFTSFLSMLSLSAAAEGSCAGKEALEISGSYSATSAIRWRVEEVPDQFIVDLSKISKADRTGISKTAIEHKFPQLDRIIRYSVDNSSRAGVIYKTDFGEVFYLKTDYRKTGGRACLPSDSINLLINNWPASLVFAKGMEKSNRCLWNLQVFDMAGAIQHSIYRPLSCMSYPKQEDANAIVQIFNDFSK